jgi:hypothetical protein
MSRTQGDLFGRTRRAWDAAVATFIVLGWVSAISAQSAELFDSFLDESTEEADVLEPDIPAQSSQEHPAPVMEAAQPLTRPATGGTSTELILSSVAATAEAAIDVVAKAKAAAAALKAAQAESMAAADAVKAATKQKNFAAIKEAKKRAEATTEAVKKAQEAADEAAEALRAAGMEAEALALGIGAATAEADGSDLAVQGGAKVRKINTYVALKYQIPEQKRTEKWGDILLEAGYFGESGAFFGYEIGFASYMGSLNRLSDSSSQIALNFAFNCGSVKSLVSDLKLVYGMSAGFYVFGELYKDTTYTSYGSEVSSGFKELSWGIFGPFIGLRWRYIEFLYKGWVCMGYKEEEGSGKNIEAVPTISYSNQIQLGLRLAIMQEIKKDVAGRVVTIRYGY